MFGVGCACVEPMKAGFACYKQKQKMTQEYEHKDAGRTCKDRPTEAGASAERGNMVNGVPRIGTMFIP